jgi:HEAT repeat protein
MLTRRQGGQANVTTILLCIALIVSGVWAWKRLSPEVQDTIVEQAIPIALLSLAVLTMLWIIGGKIRSHRARRRSRERLIARFLRETSPEKRRDLAFALIEANQYRLPGLESVAPALVEILTGTLKSAVGDKQHRIRGMAASYVGVLQEDKVVPLLLKALDDDHAHVRACAALGLGRLKAAAAKDKLESIMKEDWDQTVRSRAREALERLA